MNLNTTGKMIAQLRRNMGFTQASLAEKLGISDKAISKWERGLAFPDTSILNQLCILLDTDIESLLYGQEQPNYWTGILFLDNAISSEILIYDKPLVCYLISQFLLVGIKEIIIVGKCEPITLEGVRITVVPKLNQEFTQNSFVIYGNQFLYGPNLTKHFMRAMSRNNITVISIIKAKGKYGLHIDKDRKAILSNELSSNKYYALPYIFNSRDKNMYPFDELIEQEVNVETIGRGMIHFNINNYESAYQMASFIKMMEENTGEKIADLDDIVKRRQIKK